MTAMAAARGLLLLASPLLGASYPGHSTPPMGWMAWQRFRCQMDCTKDAAGRVNCVSEELFRSVADAMVSEGFLAAGYNFVSVDSCWAERERDERGHVVANRQRFPSGMGALSQYIHSRGLKFGLYSNMGPTMGGDGSLAPGLNCSGGTVAECPQAQADIEYYTSEYEIDYLKIDADSGGHKYTNPGGYCGSEHVRKYNRSYPLVSRLLNASGREPMFYCSWPVGTSHTCGWPLQYQLMSKHCTAMKQYHDVRDAWESIQTIIEYWARGSMLYPELKSGAGVQPPRSERHETGSLQGFLAAAKPGSWNMPDQLVVGQTPCPGYNYTVPGNPRGMHCDQLTTVEEETVFAFWAIWASPLFMSHDPRATPAASKKILLNREVIAVNQDKLGRQGFRVRNDSELGLQVWKRELHDGIAVLLHNSGEQARDISFELSEVGFDADTRVAVRDLYAGETLGSAFLGSFVARAVLPHGVRLFKLAASEEAAPDHVGGAIPTEGLVSFWDFQEREGPFIAKLGAGRYALQESQWDATTKKWSDGTGIERVKDTPPGQPFGPLSASIGEGQLLEVPRTAELAPLLNIHGDNATMTMVAWMKADSRYDNCSGGTAPPKRCGSPGSANFGHLAGIWAEPITVRTYVMFARAPRGKDIPGNHLDVEVSRTGATMQPACRWSISYALGSASLDSDVWQMVAMTFDGKAIRAFVNGSLDYRPPHRLHPVGDPCNETWQNPAPVRTWSDRTSWGPGGDPAAPQNHTTFAVGGQRGAEGAGLGHPWDGLLGGLAVYDRALEEEELQAMAANTGMIANL